MIRVFITYKIDTVMLDKDAKSMNGERNDIVELSSSIYTYNGLDEARAYIADKYNGLHSVQVEANDIVITFFSIEPSPF